VLKTSWSAVSVELIEQAVVRGEPADLPELIGELARVHATAIARLASPQRAESSDDVLLTVAGMVEQLGKDEWPAWKVRDWCRTKKLPAMKIGKEWVISAGVLRDWMRGYR
jgi:hypothetical protein